MGFCIHVVLHSYSFRILQIYDSSSLHHKTSRFTLKIFTRFYFHNGYCTTATSNNQKTKLLIGFRTIRYYEKRLNSRLKGTTIEYLIFKYYLTALLSLYDYYYFFFPFVLSYITGIN